MKWVQAETVKTMENVVEELETEDGDSSYEWIQILYQLGWLVLKVWWVLKNDHCGPSKGVSLGVGAASP